MFGGSAFSKVGELAAPPVTRYGQGFQTDPLAAQLWLGTSGTDEYIKCLPGAAERACTCRGLHTISATVYLNKGGTRGPTAIEPEDLSKVGTQSPMKQ